VSAGSIAIAGTMCVIRPFESPNGWYILGQTPVQLFDEVRPEPALLAPGDEIRLRPIGSEEHLGLREAIVDGSWVLERGPCNG
jgi:inhibitor of KinA